MGMEYGDAQNIAVRVFLNQISKKFDTFFNEEYQQKTLKYFDYKCPYSGMDISNGNFVKDHVIPINKDKCGLHLYGNILLVTREANSKKHNQSLEIFLKNEPERLAKIQAFIKESGYADIYEKYNKQLILNCKSLYEKIRNVIECDFKDFADFIKPQIQYKINIPIAETPNLQPSDNYGKIESYKFKFLKRDRNNNQYYIFPENEAKFIDEAFEDREIFVEVKYPDGYVEKIHRQITKKWTSGLYWNINSMYILYENSRMHISDAKDLIVYACPVRYK